MLARHEVPRLPANARARLAIACARAGELDRARAEGRKALAIARQTKSVTATRELKRLGTALSTA